MLFTFAKSWFFISYYVKRKFKNKVDNDWKYIWICANGHQKGV
jgi:hypothetical protein